MAANGAAAVAGLPLGGKKIFCEAELVVDLVVDVDMAPDHEARRLPEARRR